MSKKIDLTGQRFGRLIIIKSKDRSIIYECLCDCGNIKNINGHSLKRGRTKSCGCLQRELTKKRFTKHGMCGTLTYRTWQMMIQRCTNPKFNSYPDYGGRGIEVCEEWLVFEKFFKDMGERIKGSSIDRIKNHLGYSKDNCRWATQSIQNRNQRMRKDNTSGVTGVYFDKRRKNYCVEIHINCKHKFIGSFSNIEEAAIVRKQAELKYWR